MQNLIAVAKERGCHIVYASICSMESVADYNDYYKAKLADERDLEESGISHSIVRISQFHPFVSRLLSHLVVGPFMLAPKLKFQPVDVPFAAQELCRFAMERTERLTPDIHGPETLTQTDLIPSWLAVKTMKKIVLPVPRLGRLKQLGRIHPVAGIAGAELGHNGSWRNETLRVHIPGSELRMVEVSETGVLTEGPECANEHTFFMQGTTLGVASEAQCPALNDSRPNLLHSHGCKHCGTARAWRNLKDAAHVGIFVCLKCGLEGTLNVEICEMQESEPSEEQ